MQAVHVHYGSHNLLAAALYLSLGVIIVVGNDIQEAAFNCKAKG